MAKLLISKHLFSMKVSSEQIMNMAATLLAGMLSGEQGTRFYQGCKPLKETEAQVKESVVIAKMIAEEVTKG